MSLTVECRADEPGRTLLVLVKAVRCGGRVPSRKPVANSSLISPRGNVEPEMGPRSPRPLRPRVPSRFTRFYCSRSQYESMMIVKIRHFPSDNTSRTSNDRRYFIHRLARYMQRRDINNA